MSQEFLSADIPAAQAALGPGQVGLDITWQTDAAAAIAGCIS